MRPTFSTLFFLTFFALLRNVHGHIAAWHKGMGSLRINGCFAQLTRPLGMYCLNGTSGTDNPSTNEAVNPLYQLPFSDWWMHHVNNCDQFPPAPGDFLELPANGAFTVELAMNRAFTSLSFNGRLVGKFADGQNHPGLGDTPAGEVPQCIVEPNIHAQNQSMAAGSAFAISYQSDITKVTPENLVVFTVLYNSPWELVATYSVPNLPACPPGGCICAWGWVPNGCGQPNMYMLPYRCKVTGWTGPAAVAPGSPGVWCEDNPSACVKGPKQMIYWNQLEGNNIEVSGTDLAGDPRSPAYNAKLGFANGAQKNIFMKAGSATQTSVIPTSTSKPKPSNASSKLVIDVAWMGLIIIPILANLH